MSGALCSGRGGQQFRRLLAVVSSSGLRILRVTMGRRFRSSSAASAGFSSSLSSLGNPLSAVSFPSFSSSSAGPFADASSSNISTTPSSSPSSPSFSLTQHDKVLIANRGEIACRILRTCRRLQLPTVALYSVADGPQCPHALLADEAYLIGHGPAPRDSYLRHDHVLDIAQQTGARAIHPGYGFLSENAVFAQQCHNAGLVFVGPSPSALTSMGDKAQSKAVLVAAGVPVTPGYASLNRSDQDDQHLYHQAVHSVGFPLLIKAVAGGGGKGMRLVWKANEFLAALASCRRESIAAFGDDTVLLEKYLHQPRHVEVQIMADQHGNVVHLHERDCSLQRRHQKIIEEAPASDLSLEMRAHLGELGKTAARAVGYVNAGTVEFLLDTTSLHNNDNSSNIEVPNFYFCEMNTRLQVEHPITELITGWDLVEWQWRIAAGETLPPQDEIPCRGHAFEARIYAEQTTRNFLPATGTVWHHVPPPVTTTNTATTATTTVRVDTGLRTGQEVSVYYDPMISKLIVHGPDRSTALQLLIDALKRYQIAGVSTNLDFLIQCAQHETFATAGAIHTGFLQNHMDELQSQLAATTMPPPLARVAGILAVLLEIEGRRTISSHHNDQNMSNSSSSSSSSIPLAAPWSSQWGSWRMGGIAGRAQRVLQLAPREDADNVGDDTPDMTTTTTTCISNRDGSFDLSWLEPCTEGEEGTSPSPPHAPATAGESVEVVVPPGYVLRQYHVTGRWNTDNTHAMEMVVNGTQRVHLTTVMRHHQGLCQVRLWPQNLPHDYAWSLDVVDPMAPIRTTTTTPDASSSSSGRVRAPMPGKIVRLNYTIGESVPAQSVVVVMEAMKMEHACTTATGGIVTEVHCRVGDVVDDGAILVVVEPTPPPGNGTTAGDAVSS